MWPEAGRESRAAPFGGWIRSSVRAGIEKLCSEVPEGCEEGGPWVIKGSRRGSAVMVDSLSQ